MTITRIVVDEAAESRLTEHRKNAGSEELLPDLPAKDDASVAGGEHAGQTIRLRIATVNNEGQ
jgi:hypothetical protein